MIQINECKLTYDGKHLAVSARVTPLPYYENICIKKIIVDTHKTFSPFGPSNNPLFEVESEGHPKEFSYVFDIDSIGDNLFFVYFIAEGNPREDTPCGMKNSIVLAVVLNPQILFNQGMAYIKELNGCQPSKEFIDYILKDNAFKLALKTGNYTEAINLWKQIINTNKAPVNNYKCGCYA